MGRLGNLLLALVLIAILVIAINPVARQKAIDFVNRSNTVVVSNAPTATDSDERATVTPVPTLTPIPTGEGIPNTGNENPNGPIVQINWPALQATLQRFWDSLRNIKFDVNPKDNR